LTEEIKKQLLEQIDNKKPLDIVCSMNDPEAERYSLDVKSFLESNGYKFQDDKIVYASLSGGTGQIEIRCYDEVTQIIIGSNVKTNSPISFLGMMSRPA
jgi:hypothetical protein